MFVRTEEFLCQWRFSIIQILRTESGRTNMWSLGAGSWAVGTRCVDPPDNSRLCDTPGRTDDEMAKPILTLGKSRGSRSTAEEFRWAFIFRLADTVRELGRVVCNGPQLLDKNGPAF